ncbi:hypothetical protein HYC85_010927 [Camellia sinensis]|uniref:Homeobox domain-containing protein n=1 Tax=Camellia sinensis TaxID=4442 RepID=A0A7J7HJF1_CAMSI|nr:hypothetical protein HYC85_010927 [Camellia sinensis]
MAMAHLHRKSSSDSINRHLDAEKYVRYTGEQVEALERVYAKCPKPSSLRPQQLIRDCPILSNIEPKQIKVWFQNRRCREKQRKEASRLQTVNRKMTAMNKLLMEENDRYLCSMNVLQASATTDASYESMDSSAANRSGRGSVAATEPPIRHPSARLVDWRKSIRIRPPIRRMWIERFGGLAVRLRPKKSQIRHPSAKLADWRKSIRNRPLVITHPSKVRRIGSVRSVLADRFSTAVAFEAEDVNQAVSAARKAFDQGPWPKMTAYERSRIMLRFADLLEKHSDHIVALETWDNGKPYEQAANEEIPLPMGRRHLTGVVSGGRPTGDR